MKGLNLKHMYETQGATECTYKLREALDKRLLSPNDFSLREMAVAFCGYDWYSKLNANSKTGGYQRSVSEAGEAVDVSAFSNITGQLVFTKIMEGWKNATKVSEQIFETMQTEFSGEKLPWLSNVVQLGKPVHPGQPYPEANFNERYINTPATQKHGLIVSVTKEMIFFDRTGQVMRSANQVGEKVGYEKEILCLRTFLGIDNSYQLNGTSYNTYLSSGGWINTQGSTPLVDYTSVQSAYTLASQVLDPDTQLPIQIELKDIFVMPANLFQAKRIVGASETRNLYPGLNASSPAAPGNVEMIAPNPIDPLSLLTSQLAPSLLTTYGGVNATQANAYWYVGDFKKSFGYAQNWPITVVEAPLNNIRDFEQDIIMRWKASEMGIPFVSDPRFTFKMYNT